MNPIWERLPKETGQAWEAWLIYREMEPADRGMQMSPRASGNPESRSANGAAAGNGRIDAGEDIELTIKDALALLDWGIKNECICYRSPTEYLLLI